MLRLLAAVICVLGLAACAEVPPAPGTGGSGGGGTGGSGTGGMGGTAGMGGSGGANPCTLIILEPDDETIESSDSVKADGEVTAFLCSGGQCEPEDLLDSWSFVLAPTCGGTYQILLTWDNNLDDDLDLALIDSDGETMRRETRTAEGTKPGSLTEEITKDLESEKPYVVQAIAINTSGNDRNYRLEVLLVD